MVSSGLLYDSSWSRPSGTVWLRLDEVPTSRRDEVGPPSLLPTPYSLLHKSRSVFKFAANLMLLIGSAGLLLTMLPVAAIELKYQLEVNREQRTANSEQAVNGSRFTVNEASPPPPDTGVSLGDLLGPVNETQAFSITIPKISASSVVIPNVDPGDPKIYMEALKKGVAHALGTGFPAVNSAVNRTIYLFAHFTSAPSLVAQYNAQFYLLHKLAVGDEINLTFWAKNYKYRVADIKITGPDDVSFLTPQTGKEILVLATCWPPGTTFKRLLVLAEREN